MLPPFPVATVVGLKRASLWAAAALVALGCGSKFYGVDPPNAGEGGAGGADSPSEGGAGAGGTAGAGAEASAGKTSAGEDGGGGASPSVGGGISPGGGAGGISPGGAGGQGGALPLGGGGVGGIVSLSPVPEEGLELWLDAERGIAQKEGGVTEWKDRSIHGRNATQSDAGKQPLFAAEGLNGKPSLVFDGTDDFLKGAPLPGDFTAGVTLFVVGRTDSSDACTAYFEASNGSEIDDVHLGFWQKHYLYEVSDSFFEVMTEQVLRTPEIVVGLQQRSGDVHVRRNGKLLGQAKFELPVLRERKDVLIGWTQYNSCTSLKGRVSEVLVYSRGLSVEEISRVETYLQTKWGCCSE